MYWTFFFYLTVTCCMSVNQYYVYYLPMNKNTDAIELHSASDNELKYKWKYRLKEWMHPLNELSISHFYRTMLFDCVLNLGSIPIENKLSCWRLPLKYDLLHVTICKKKVLCRCVINVMIMCSFGIRMCWPRMVWKKDAAVQDYTFRLLWYSSQVTDDA